MSSILKVDQLQDSGGNALITSDGSGNITTQKLLYPAFEAQLGASQVVSDATTTKVQCGVENLDTDNCYDNTTNYRFTPTVAGKYFVYANINLNSSTNNTLLNSNGFIYKNGSSVHVHANTNQGNPVTRSDISLSCVLDMNGSTDYVEIFGYVDNSSGTPRIGSSVGSTYFGAYRIGD